MLLYFFVFLIITLFALVNDDSLNNTVVKNKDKYSWISISFILIIFVGLRDSVGGDFGNYINSYYKPDKPFSDDLVTELHIISLIKDISFVLINKLVAHYNGTPYLVNLILVFSFSKPELNSITLLVSLTRIGNLLKLFSIFFVIDFLFFYLEVLYSQRSMY